LNLFENGRAASPATGLKRQKFPVFSRETGNTEAETGSPMTASTASFLLRTPDSSAPTPKFLSIAKGFGGVDFTAETLDRRILGL
jgi:hypothetical protein